MHLTDTNEVPESELLRDIIFILQGINGKYIKFNDSTLEAERRRPPVFSSIIQEDEDDSVVLEVGIKVVENGVSRFIIGYHPVFN